MWLAPKAGRVGRSASGPEPTLTTHFNAAVRPVEAAIGASRSILSAETLVSGQKCAFAATASKSASMQIVNKGSIYSVSKTSTFIGLPIKTLAIFTR